MCCSGSLTTFSGVIYSGPGLRLAHAYNFPCRAEEDSYPTLNPCTTSLNRPKNSAYSSLLLSGLPIDAGRTAWTQSAERARRMPSEAIVSYKLNDRDTIQLKRGPRSLLWSIHYTHPQTPVRSVSGSPRATFCTPRILESKSMSAEMHVCAIIYDYVARSVSRDRLVCGSGLIPGSPVKRKALPSNNGSGRSAQPPASSHQCVKTQATARHIKGRPKCTPQ